VGNHSAEGGGAFMGTVGQLLQGLSFLVEIVCFILIVVKMFQTGNTGLGIASIVLVFCCGIGGLLAFIMGWVKNREWNARQIMLIWTAAIIVHFIGGVLSPPDFSEFQRQWQMQQQQLQQQPK
jgi:hypothetical protein